MAKTEVVKKANALVEAAYHPASLYQMRLLLVAISQIKEGQKVTHKTEFEIAAADMADLIGISGRAGTHFLNLKKAADALVDMSIRVTEHPDGRPRSPRYWKINVVDSCGYVEGEGKVVLRFTPSIIPYVTELENRYKTYKLAHVIRMKSMYGMRLYELCLQWDFPNGFKELTVKEFRRLMGLEGKYKELHNLKSKVLRPAIRDINTCSDLNITEGQRSAGRTVSHLQFTITKKPKRSKATPRPGSLGRLTKEYIEINAQRGESWEDAKERLRLKLQKEKKAP